MSKAVKIVLGVFWGTPLICALVMWLIFADSLHVERLIENIGTVTYESGEQIQIAVEAYEELDEYAKSNVENYDLLAKSSKTYNSLIVIRDTIDQIKANGIKLMMRKQIQNALDMYKELSIESQKLIESPDILLEAYETVESLARINNVVQLISNVEINERTGMVYRESLSTIDEARHEYDKLVEDEKAQVTNYDDLIVYEGKTPPGWGSPVLTEDSYWEYMIPKVRDLLESHNLYVTYLYSIPPYYRFKVVTGKPNNDGTYSRVIVDRSEIDRLKQTIENELSTILDDYALEHGSGLFDGPSREILGIDFQEVYLYNKQFGELSDRPCTSLQVDLMNFYYGDSKSFSYY